MFIEEMSFCPCFHILYILPNPPFVSTFGIGFVLTKPCCHNAMVADATLTLPQYVALAFLQEHKCRKVDPCCIERQL